MRTAEVLAARILFWGGVASVLMMTLGIIGFAAQGGLRPELITEARASDGRGAERPPDVFVSVPQVARALSQWPVRPLAIVASGVVLLLITPFVAATALFVWFVKSHDRRYATVSAVVLAALLLSLMLR